MSTSIGITIPNVMISMCYIVITAAIGSLIGYIISRVVNR